MLPLTPRNLYCDLGLDVPPILSVRAAGDTLDVRFADTFAIAGTASDCLDQARRYRAAGVTELALTFGGAQPREDIAYLGAALAAAG